MKFYTKDQRRRLLANGTKNGANIARDGSSVGITPVVKLFCPWGAATWLISEIDPDEPWIAFGLCDLGMGEPEIGSVSLDELAALRGPLALQIERDLHFKADKTLAQYAEQARRLGRIKA
jgi:hypothetical protein